MKFTFSLVVDREDGTTPKTGRIDLDKLQELIDALTARNMTIKKAVEQIEEMKEDFNSDMAEIGRRRDTMIAKIDELTAALEEANNRVEFDLNPAIALAQEGREMLEGLSEDLKTFDVIPDEEEEEEEDDAEEEG